MNTYTTTTSRTKNTQAYTAELNARKRQLNLAVKLLAQMVARGDAAMADAARDDVDYFTAHLQDLVHQRR